jgi:peptidoglycan/xylan/chitin deacetylase (PgdA/CDA1 family)
MTRRPKILTYHRIYTPNNKYSFNLGAVSATPEAFEAQIAYIKQHRNIISCSDLLNAIKTNSKLPSRSTMITFDDGYVDNYSVALPILKKYGVKAIFFITTGYIDQSIRSWSDDLAYIINHTDKKFFIFEQKNKLLKLESQKNKDKAIKLMNHYCKFEISDNPSKLIKELAHHLEIKLPRIRLFMNWSEVKELHNTGMTIASHTATHPNLTQISEDSVNTEVQESFNVITKKIGNCPQIFAYPYGERIPADTNLQQLLRKLNIKIALTSCFGSTRLDPRTNLMIVKRINMHYLMGMMKFRLVLWGGFNKLYKVKHLDQTLFI